MQSWNFKKWIQTYSDTYDQIFTYVLYIYILSIYIYIFGIYIYICIMYMNMYMYIYIYISVFVWNTNPDHIQVINSSPSAVEHRQPHGLLEHLQRCPANVLWFRPHSLIQYLVGGYEHFLFSHILGIIIPIDYNFSEGFKPPTRYGLTWFNFHCHIF